MTHDAFVKIDKKETRNYIEALDPSFENNNFSGENITVLAQELSFYPGFRLLDIGDYGVMPPVKKFAVCKKDENGIDVYMMDGTPAPIKAMNDKGLLKLDTATIVPYVKFYFAHIHGEKGMFQIVESVDDLKWLEEPPPAARQALGKMIKLLDVIDAAHLPFESDFILKASMVYRDSLFSCNVHVKSDGSVSISDEEMHIEDMPLIDDIIGQ